jgi:uncharacterized membrane protein
MIARVATTGFVIWLLATVALRLGGHWVLDPASGAAIAALMAISAPVMFYLPRRIFARLSLDRDRYALAAIALVAPGMALDTISAIWFAALFPNIRPDAAGLFGGWLLFCNLLALIGAATAPRPADAASRATAVPAHATAAGR